MNCGIPGQAARLGRRDKAGPTSLAAAPVGSGLHTSLDSAIAGLMIAILVTLSLPVCIAAIEQIAIRQAAPANSMTPRHGQAPTAGTPVN